MSAKDGESHTDTTSALRHKCKPHGSETHKCLFRESGRCNQQWAAHHIHSNNTQAVGRLASSKCLTDLLRTWLTGCHSPALGVSVKVRLRVGRKRAMSLLLCCKLTIAEAAPLQGWPARGRRECAQAHQVHSGVCKASLKQR